MDDLASSRGALTVPEGTGPDSFVHGSGSRHGVAVDTSGVPFWGDARSDLYTRAVRATEEVVVEPLGRPPRRGLFGRALAVDYSLSMVNRFREDVAPGVAGALERTIAAAGRTITFSALTMVASLAGLFAFGDPTFNSLATGGAATTVPAPRRGLTLIPALLADWGAKIKTAARAPAEDEPVPPAGPPGTAPAGPDGRCSRRAALFAAKFRSCPPRAAHRNQDDGRIHALLRSRTATRRSHVSAQGKDHVGGQAEAGQRGTRDRQPTSRHSRL